MPKVPILPATIKYKNRKVVVVSTISGTVYKQIAEKAIIITAGVEIIPDFTAVSPKTSAPTTERANPTYLGIRTDASFKTSNTNSVKKISTLGDRGIPATELAILKSSFAGIN